MFLFFTKCVIQEVICNFVLYFGMLILYKNKTYKRFMNFRNLI